MKICIIGQGAIGRYVANAIGTVDAYLVRPARLSEAQSADSPIRVADVAGIPDAIDLVVDCAGHEALKAHGADILARGMDLVTVSLGALADNDLHQRLRGAAEASGARLHLATGAIGALDCLQAAREGGLDRVIYRGRKPALGWKGSPAEDVLDLDRLDHAATHFDGNARDAASRYPKNANVAAAVALAGMGFDATEVTLIADPASQENIHEIEAAGAFGSFHFTISGRSLPDNPRSSALAAMSTVAAIRRQRARIVI